MAAVSADRGAAERPATEDPILKRLATGERAPDAARIPLDRRLHGAFQAGTVGRSTRAITFFPTRIRRGATGQARIAPMRNDLGGALMTGAIAAGLVAPVLHRQGG